MDNNQLPGTVLPSKDAGFFSCNKGRQGENSKSYANVYDRQNVKHVLSTLVLKENVYYYACIVVLYSNIFNCFCCRSHVCRSQRISLSDSFNTFAHQQINLPEVYSIYVDNKQKLKRCHNALFFCTKDVFFLHSPKN